MLKLEISLPDKCHERSKVLDLCLEIEDDTIYLLVKACAECSKMFIPIRADHRFCYRGQCRQDFHNRVRETRRVSSDPSNS